MKIHRIQTLNLNSLYGSFTLDFDQHFNNVPLFLIHGPTGAGKSTLLDAICLALYGQTPRLTSTNKSTDQISTQHIMSHGTVECHAAVMFSLRSPCGTTRDYFRAEWTSERAHKKTKLDGTIKNAQRSLIRVDANGQQIGEPITASDKPKDYQEHFDRILAGMDINAFQRSVMLAQGQFSEFLKANDQQKNAILERLTDTSHYRDIGARAATRKKESDEALAKYKNQMENIKFLSPEKLEEHNAELFSATTLANAHETQRKEFRQQILWINTFQTLNTEQQTTAQQLASKQQIHIEHAQDFTRLKRDAACQPAANLRLRVIDTRTQRTQLEHLLPNLRETVTATEKTAHQADEHQKTAARLLIDAKTKHAAAQPALQKARETLKARNISAQELTKSEAHHTQTTQEYSQAARAKSHTDKTLQTTSEALAAATNHRDSLQSAAAITEQLADWQTRASRLTATRSTLTSKQIQIQETTTELEKLTQEHTQKDKLLSHAQNELAPLTTASEKTQEALNLMLHTNQCTDIPELRNHFEALRETASNRKTTLERTLEKHQILEKLSTDQKTHLEERNTLTKSLKSLREQQTNREKDIQHTQNLIATLEQSLQGFIIALSFSKARSELTNDSHCPVCGSLDHPFIHTAHNQNTEPEHELNSLHDQARTKLQTAENDLSNHQNALQTLLTTIARQDQSLETSNKNLEELDSTYKKSSAELLAQLHTLGFDLDTPQSWTSADYSTHISAAITAHQRANENLQALQNAIDAHTKAVELRRNAVEQTQKLQEQITVLKIQIENQTARRETLQTEQTELTTSRTNDEKSLLQNLNACNIEVPKTNENTYDLAAALAQATALKQAFDAAHQAAATCNEQFQTAQKTQLAAQITLEGCAKNLQAAKTLLEERKSEKIAFDHQFQLCLQDLNGKMPETVEAELNLAIQTAEKQLENAQITHNNARDAHTKAQTELAARTRSHAELSEKLTRETTEFSQKLAELNLDEETLTADLLSDEERTTLKAKTTEITDDLNKAQAVHTATSARLEAHQTAKPEALQNLTGLEELSMHSQQLTQESSVLEKERDTITEQIGRLKEILAESARASQEHRALQQGLDQREREASMWNEIYKLIGVGSGENFQRFAQSLNLGELVRAANGWLQKLFPRYELGVLTGKDGEPTLTFTIIDLENAGKERPINTLSGGETFVVSLALALALADFSQIRMPLETILLDEGFGTLDSETLDSVLNVLNALQQQSGRQIGIISHVEGLKERIDYRIHIEKQNRTQSGVTIITGGVSVNAATSEALTP